MADEEEKQEGKPKEKKSSGGLLPIINLVLLLLVLAVGGFIAWTLMQMEKPTAQTGKVAQTEDTAIPEAADDTGQPPVLVGMDTITVNLADTDISRYLHTKIDLAVRNEEAKAKIEANKAKINDLVITLLSSKKFSDIRTPQGKYALKEEMVYRINRAVGGKPVKSLYFTDFVSQ
ncbi:MAG: flagellar basal body-associated FliL family protein [Mariprofundaceae bacterium]|nr:flagellar basal body-associated FliL family protein [Mariprofundaceae bacterium]